MEITLKRNQYHRNKATCEGQMKKLKNTNYRQPIGIFPNFILINFNISAVCKSYNANELNAKIRKSTRMMRHCYHDESITISRNCICKLDSRSLQSINMNITLMINMDDESVRC